MPPLKQILVWVAIALGVVFALCMALGLWINIWVVTEERRVAEAMRRLRSRVPSERLIAISALKRPGTLLRGSIDELSMMLNTEQDPSVRSALADLLGDIGSDLFTSAARARERQKRPSATLTTDSDPEELIGAIRKVVLPALVTASRSSDAIVSEAAREALKHIGLIKASERSTSQIVRTSAEYHEARFSAFMPDELKSGRRMTSMFMLTQM